MISMDVFRIYLWNSFCSVIIGLRSILNEKAYCRIMSAIRPFGPGNAVESLGYFIMQRSALLKDKFALHRLVKLRQRHIMTKANKIRLRYVASFFFVGALCLAVSFTAVAPSFALFSSTENTESSEVVALATLPAVQVYDETVASMLQNHISEGIRKASAAIQKSQRSLHKDLKVGNGDTIAGVLESAGINGADSYQIVQALSTHYDPRKVQAGQNIRIDFKPSGAEDVQFSKMTMKLDPVKEIKVVRDGDEFVADIEEKELLQRSYARTAEIETSLYGSAAAAGIPQQVIAEMIRVYSWDIDFQRDIRQGDKIEVLYDTYETEDGELARYGDVVYANLTVGGKEVPVYRFEMRDGRVDYFQPDGHSIRKALMKTPIDGARISSGFGMRKHPVLGYNKMHKGVDFAAPTGTPIYAAGDGVIEYAGRKGAYGNYLSLRHNSTLKTAYAHMHKFAKGISAGKRVSQGDIVGYVGTTGRSTGPHLHYEVLVNNAQKNPNSIDLPTGEQLAGNDLARFKSMMTTMHQQYIALSEGLKFAEKDTGPRNPIR